MGKSGHSGKPLHKSYAETGKVEEHPTIGTPSPRFYAKGGFVKSQSFAQVKGARAGYSHKVGKKK